MLLSTLINSENLTLTQGPAGLNLPDLTDDSRRVTPGALFIARPGTKDDGGKFIADALAKGASAILIQQGAPLPSLPPNIALITAPAVDNLLVGHLAQKFYNFPARKLKLIGITGTNGKTTITFVVRHILARQAVKCGVIGTVLIDDGKNQIPADLTTPGAIDIAKYLAAMVDNGCAAAVMEVSSHALHQSRAHALDFSVAVFTNLTGDHLDYHKTMEAYADAKAILFERLAPTGFAIINEDDAYSARMIRDTKASVIRCSLKPGEYDKTHCRALIQSASHKGTRIRFEGPWGSYDVLLPLVGKHNAMNVLQAAVAANCVSAISRTLRDSLQVCPAPPGRLDPVILPGGSGGDPASLPAVLVDYAHTHDALENVLQALRAITKGRVITLFGCGGDRDRTKRPKMAKVACDLSDKVFITSDNPRTEDPNFIISEILTGVPTDKKSITSVDPDRAKSIRAAIMSATPDDVVLLAGKGHEDYQIIGKEKHHFSDHQEAAKALTSYKHTPTPV
jgi:UDP-N-acetylmuramoyl-L-alanyl-D-glutamate--2,6-diaminopimelate ligase